MKIDIGKRFCLIFLIVGLLITVSPLAQTQQLRFDSISTFSSGHRDFLVNQTIEIWFTDVLDFFTLDPNTSFESNLGDSVILRYSVGNEYFSIFSFNGNFMPLDKITVTLESDISSNSGSLLGTTHTFDILIGPVVYPGDTDNDGVVDERDILPLGIYWNNTGTIRPDSTSLFWQMKPTHRWTNLRATYADADGNGIVEADDICGISENFGRSQLAFTAENKNNFQITLKETSPGFATQIYAALVDCSNKGVGKQALLDILEPIVKNDPQSLLPEDFLLYQNYPNPFNPSTTIEYYLPEAVHVTITVFNVTGQSIKTLVDNVMPNGFNETNWDGLDYNNNPVSSGIYFYRMNTGDESFVKRMLLLK